MFTLSEEEIKTLQHFATQAGPNCSKCNSNSCWMDWGPIVGKGWYCRSCKDDVDSPDNVYGSIAAAKRKEAAKPFNPAAVYYDNINCTKPGCPLCSGAYARYSAVDIKPGEWVRCTFVKGAKKLSHLGRYQVVAVEPTAIRIQVGNEQLAFVRCRFQIERYYGNQAAS